MQFKPSYRTIILVLLVAIALLSVGQILLTAGQTVEQGGLENFPAIRGFPSTTVSAPPTAEEKPSVTIPSSESAIIEKLTTKLGNSFDIRAAKQTDKTYNINLSLSQAKAPSDKNFEADINGLSDPAQLQNAKYVTAKQKGFGTFTFRTPIFAIETGPIANATIKLPKSGNVDVILKCSNFNYNAGTCNNWETTDISFSQDEQSVTFTVESFSGYVGASSEQKFGMLGGAPDFTITSTSDFDSGTKSNLSTETDEYNISTGFLELASPPYAKDSALVLFTPMDEGTGSTAADYSSQAHNASLSSVSWITGKYGKGTSYNGANSYGDVGDYSVYEFSGDFTIEVWLNQSASTAMDYISKWNGGGAGWQAWWLGYYEPDYVTYQVSFGLYNSTTANIAYNSTNPITLDNTWHQIIAERSGTHCYIYKDGVMVLDATVNCNQGTVGTSGQSLLFGTHGSKVNWLYSGYMDNVRIYNKSLSSSEVRDLYNSGNRYKLTGNWTSAIVTMPSNRKMNDTTITYSNVDANNYISKIEWLVGDVVKATYDTDITSGTSITISNSSLTSGSFDDVNESFNIRVYLVGNGTNTPAISQIEGTFAGTGAALTCGDTISGYVVMGSDINCTNTNGFNIFDDDTVLNCDGYTIDGDYSGGNTTSGILIAATAHNVTIENCTISDFGGGLTIYANNTTVLNNRITQCSDAADLQNTDSVNFTGNNVTNSSTGFYLPYCNNTIIDNNNFISIAGSSIFFMYSYFNNITYNNFSSGSSIINFIGSENNTLSNNMILDGSNGIQLSSTGNTTISDNYVCYNTLDVYMDTNSHDNSGNNTCSVLQDDDSNNVNCTTHCAFAQGVCGKTIHEDVTLTEDITSCSSSNGINIGSNGITLDCNGHTISGTDIGSGYRGIYAWGYSSITIKNCTVSNFTSGMFLYFGNNITVLNSRVNQCGDAMDSQSIDNLSFTGNNITNNNYGLYIPYISNATINNNNFISNGGNSITFVRGYFNNITYNNFSSYSNAIYFSSSGNNTVSNNIILSGSGGIISSSTSNTTISDNEICYNSYSDVSFDSDSHNNSGNNTCSLILDSDLNTLNCTTHCIFAQGMCGQTIVDDTTLTQDINCSSSIGINTGVTIGADNIVLDCNGYAIIGPGPYTYGYYGVYNNGHSNITVKNCTISNFWDGLHFLNSAWNSTLADSRISQCYEGTYFNNNTGSNFMDNNITSNSYIGLYITYCNNTTLNNNNLSSNNGGPATYLAYDYYSNITYNNISSNYQGIYFSQSENDTASNNLITANQYGIYSQGTGNSTISDNDICYNSAGDIYLSSDSHNNSGNNTCSGLFDSDSNNVNCTTHCIFIQGLGGQTIADDTTLTQNISASSSNGINIGTNGIILDCNGHTIIGSGSYSGIENDGFANVTIKNCIIIGFGNGIYFGNNVNNNTIYNNTITSVSSWGIYMYGSSHNTILNNNISDCGYICIGLDASPNNTLTDNTIFVYRNSTNKGEGVTVYGSTVDEFRHNITTSNTINGLPIDYYDGVVRECPNNTLLDIGTSWSFVGLVGCDNITINGSLDNNLDGIIFAGTSNSVVQNVNISYSRADAIDLILCSNDTVVNSTANYDDGYGLLMYLGSNNKITNNDFSLNYEGVYTQNEYNDIVTDNNLSLNGEGVDIENSNYTVVNNNIMDSNRWGGIYIIGSYNNNFTGNSLSNTEDGIYLDWGSENNIIFNNTLNNNTDAGIYLWSSINNTFINNTAKNNTLWDFYSNGESFDNIVTNLEIGSLTVSFTSKDIALKNSSSPGGEPLQSLGLYLDAVNNSPDSWLFLNVSYTDADIIGVGENTLRMSKYNSSGWFTDPTDFTDGIFGIDNVSNYIYANITNFGSIFAPLGEYSAITVSDCINLTQANKVYELTTNISGNQTDRPMCIDIQANNVTLNCDNNLINGSGGDYGITGINMFNVNDTRISNCNIENYYIGINMTLSNNNTITDNTINDNGYLDIGYGLYMMFSSNNTLTNNVIDNNGYNGNGVFIFSSSYNNFTNNTANNNNAGFNIDQGANNSFFIDNIVSNNRDRGFYIASASNNVLINNSAINNTNVGVYIVYGMGQPCVNNTLINNTFDYNGVGINIQNGGNHSITSNKFDNNNIGILVVEDSNNTVLKDNSAKNNTVWDIYTGGNNNTFINQTVGDGIYETSFNATYFYRYGYYVGINGVSSPPIDPPSYYNIGKYINATNISGAGGWLSLNISYNESDLSGIDENTLFIARNNDTWETNTSVFAAPGSFGINNVSKYVYANITDFGSIFAPMGEHISNKVLECKNLTVANTIYNVTANISGNQSNGICIDIQADNVTLDCNGIYYIGPADVGGGETIGVHTNKNNVTVQNCFVYEYTDGIYFNSSYGSNVLNNTITQTMPGIFIINSSYINLMNNTVTNSGGTDIAGIILRDSNNSSLINNNASENDRYGIMLFRSSNNELINNTCLSNQETGLWIVLSSNNIISNNTANGNHYHGILLGDSNNNTVTNNTANFDGVGIFLQITSNNSLINNSISDSNIYGDGGIVIDRSSNTIVEDNYIENSTNGIYFEPEESSNNTLIDNTVLDNRNWAFYSLTDPSFNSVNNTVINMNIGSALVSFTFRDIALKSASSPGWEPLQSIGKYLNATNTSTNSWLFLNTSYEELIDLGEVNESTLRMSKYNGSGWYTNPATFTNGVYGVNNVSNYVYANITKFGSIFAPLGAITNITHCINITVSGSYMLGTSIHGNQSPGYGGGHYNPCIDIQASNVILDCNNHYVIGDYLNYTFGIFTSNRVTLDNDNITIKNCHVENYAGGIYFEFSDNDVIENNTVVNNNLSSVYFPAGSGIAVHGPEGTHSDNATIINNKVYNNGIGIVFDGINDNVSNNIADNNDYGIYSDYYVGVGFGTTIFNNTANDSAFYGFYFGGAANNFNISDNTAKENDIADFYFDAQGASACAATFINNIGSGDRQVVFLNGSKTLSGGTPSELILCTADGSNISNVNVVGSDTKQNNGIFLITTGYANLTNVISSDNYYGLFNIYSYNNTISRSSFNNNQYGIYDQGSSGYNFTNNTAKDNTAWDVYLWDYSSDSYPSSKFTNLDIGPANLSFLGSEVALRNASAPVTLPPFPLQGIDTYVNATNLSIPEQSWLFVNISYNDSIISSDENTLNMSKYNESGWFTNPTTFTDGTFGVDTNYNYVYANITNFDSIFAPLGETISTNVSGCRDLTSADTVYTLTDNLNGTQSGKPICIEIMADNVTLDCNGWNITGDDRYGMNAGIFGMGYNNLTIRNCIVQNYTYNMYMSTQYSSIINNTANDGYSGMELLGTSYSNITSNIVNNNQNGIQFSGNNNTLINNTVNNNYYDDVITYDGGFGIIISGEYNLLINNTANNNSMGLYLNGDRNTVINNTFMNNYYSSGLSDGGYGIIVWDNVGNNLSGNNVSMNVAGIYVLESSYNNLIGNIAYNNTFGILLNYTSDNNLTSNIAYNNEIAISLESGSNNNLTNNIVSDNNGNGIDIVSSSDSNTLINNTANNEGHYGFAIYSPNNNLTNNIANNNKEGIIITDVNNTLINNTANNNYYVPEPELTGQGISIRSQYTMLINNTANNNSVGLYINADYNTIINNTFMNNYDGSGLGDYGYGIEFDDANSNNLINNTADNNTVWDFYSLSSSNNTVTSLTTNDTISSFTYDGDVGLKSADGSSSPNPLGYTNISHYLNITNMTEGTWIFLNISYKDSDVSSIITDNSTIKIWKHSSGIWTDDIGTPNTIDEVNHIVYANITNFSSIYAPMGEYEPPLNVSNCMNLTQANKVYTLITNLSGNQTGRPMCIDVQTTNATLDCDGHNMTGITSFGEPLTGTFGIFVYENYNVTIRNCLIFNYSTGLHLNSSSNFLIEGNTISSNDAGLGIDMIEMYGATIRNNVISNNYDGVWSSWSSQYNNYVNNTISNNARFGMYFSTDGGYNNITNNTISNNAYDGISILFSPNNLLTGNTISDNYDFGVYDIEGGTYINNTVHSNTNADIYTACLDSTFINQTIGSSSPTTISFTCNGNMHIKGITGQPTDIPGYTNISRYVEFSNDSSGAWAYVNFSYDSIPTNVFHSSVKVWKASTSFYYQENANSTSCVGSWTSQPCSNVYDGNWYTGSSTDVGTTGFYYANYSKPSNTIGAYWQVNDTYYPPYNITIPSDCWAQSQLQLRGESNNVDTSFIKWYCWNGSDWHALSKHYYISGVLWEEAIWWENANWSISGTGVGTPNGINETLKIVYANITNFSSIYAPMGETAAISNCRNLTNADTVYTLISNLTGNQSSGKCIDIQATNITLECNNSYINGTYPGNTYGVFTNSSNTTIQNCFVQNYTGGINVNYSSYNIIINNTVYNNSEGIFVTSGIRNNLTNNTATNNSDYGIVLTGVSYTNVDNNKVYTNKGGFFIYGSLSINLTNNNASYNYPGTGIGIGSSNYTRLVNNTANNNRLTYSIWLYQNSRFNTLINNTANYNSVGFYLSSSSSNNLTDNIANNNIQYGIYFESSVSNNLTNNTANNNTFNGIQLKASNNSNIINNTAKNNKGWDFNSSLDSLNNIVTNLEIGSTIVSFNSIGIGLKNASSPGGEPYTSIGKYVNATNNSANSWLFLNISYNVSDLGGVYESTLNMAKYNATSPNWWTNPATFATSYGVDNVSHYVYANITNFGSIFAPMGETTTISNCKNLTLANNVYTLVANLTGHQQNGICIDVQADNVTLNCDGYNITGNSSSKIGVNILTHNNTIIKNCNINYYSIGIQLSFASNSTLFNNTANNNTNNNIMSPYYCVGIAVYNSTYNNITNNTANNDSCGLAIGQGIVLANSSNNNITNNIANRGSWAGIALYLSSINNLIENNTVNTSNADNIRIDSSSNNSLINNLVSSAFEFGVYIVSGSNSTMIADNQVYNCNQGGIYVAQTSNNNITNNTVANNKNWGIMLDQSSNNNVTNNNASNTPSAYGIAFDSAIGNTIINNIANNDSVGISFSHVSSNNILINNTANKNAQYGIYLNSSSNNNLTNNTANNNKKDGINVTFSSYNNITDNIVYNNTQYGICLSYGSNNTITNNNASLNINGIYLFSSSNNILTNNTAYNNTDYGIYLGSSSNNNTLINNTLYKNRYGIELQSSSNNTIDNNAAYNSTYGINIDSSSYNNLTNNTIYYTSVYGMSTSSSDHIIFANNTIYNNSEGIRITGSTNNILIENKIRNNGDGLGFAYSSDDNLAINNTLENNGIWLWSSYYDTLENNTINSTSSCIIFRAGSGSSTLLDNTLNNCGTGINLESWNNNNTIFDNTVSSGSYGIALHSCVNNTINNNTINNNSQFGIYSVSSSNNNLTNNTLYENPYGIYLQSSSNNNVANNTAYNNSVYGIELYGGSYNNITNNSLYSNYGGIQLWPSSNNNIIENKAYNNRYEGIYLFADSNYNTLINNTVYNNVNEGIWVRSSSNNNILIDNIVYNNSNGISIFQSSSNNTVYNTIAYNNSYGVYINGNNNIVSNTTAYFNLGGILISDCDNNTIANNTVYSNAQGIYILYSGVDNVIFNNTIYNNYEGIKFWNHANADVIFNNISNSTYGINLYSSPNNNFSSNIIYNSSLYGINFESSSSTGNIAFNNTIYDSGSTGIRVYSNANNNSLIENTIYTSNTGILFSGVYNSTSNNNTIYNCGVGIYLTLLDSCNITNNNITNSTSYGIYSFTGSNNTFENNTVHSNHDKGIYLKINSNYNKLINNTVYSNTNEGILLESSSQNDIINNTADYNGYGIYTYYSNNNNLTLNNVSGNNYVGILLYSSNDSILTNNIAKNHTQWGVYLEDNSINNTLTNNIASDNPGTGIILSYTVNSTLTNNTANNNGGIGIYVLDAYKDNLNNNTANNNNQSGIEITDSNNITLINNTINNNLQGIAIGAGSNHIFINTNATNNTIWDFASYTNSPNNKVFNLTTNDTTSSFTYNGDIKLKSANGSNSPNPPKYTNLSHYLNITNISAAWIFINISYKDSDVPSSVTHNSTIQIWKNSSGVWTNDIGTPNTIDQSLKIVYANITKFGSIFAPLGNTNRPPTMINITANTTYAKVGDTINVSTAGAWDIEGDSYYLMCGNTSSGSELCNSTLTTNGTEAWCTFASPWTDDTGHTIYCRLIDTLDISAENTTDVIADNTNATATILSPSNHTHVNGIVTIQASADDSSGSGVKNVTFEYFNTTDSTWNLIGYSPTGPIYSTTWDVTPLPDNSIWTVRIVPEDGVEHFNYDADNITLHVDHTVPEIMSIDTIYPAGQSAVRNGQNVILNVSVRDVVAGTKNVTVNLSLIGGLDSKEMIFVGGDNTSGQIANYSNTELVSGAVDGIQLLEIIATDNATPTSNIASGQYFVVLVDSSAPEVTLVSPGDDTWNNSKIIDFLFNVNDNTNLVNCSVWTNESGWTLKVPNTSAVLNDSIGNVIQNIFGNDGSYLWNVKCYDIAFNPAFAPGNFTIKIDTTGPDIPYKDVNQTTTNMSDTVCINATVTDAGIGVDQVWATVTYPNSTVTNVSLSNSTGPCYGGSTYGTEINVGTVPGELFINTTYANDTFNDIGTNDTVLTVNILPQITECTNLTKANTVYILTRDLIGNQSDGICIDVQEANITLDCIVYNVTGNESGVTYGIYSNNDNTTIQNCYVQSYTQGITLSSSLNNILLNNIANNNSIGISISLSSNNNITNNTASNNIAYGFYVASNSNNNLINNIVNNNSLDGIYLDSSTNNNITNNTANNNAYTGIYIELNSNSILTNNTANNNTYYGVAINSSFNTLINNTANYNQEGFLIESDNNILANNTANNDLNDGISIESSYNNLIFNTVSNANIGIGLYADNNTIISNIANNNTNIGIFLDTSSNNNLDSNIANNNTYWGIYFNSGSNNNTLTSNTLNNNLQYGIYIDSSSNNTLTNCTATNNTEWDFYSEDPADLSVNNTIVNLTTNNTTCSFTYGGYIGIKGVTSPPADLLGVYRNVSKYVDATNLSAGAWLALNISYDDTGVNESKLNMGRYDGTWEGRPGIFANNYGVNAIDNYVYANITDFGSIFAPLELIFEPNVTILINGVETENFTNAGEPYNVTIIVRNGITPVPSDITFEEGVGYLPFALPQTTDSNVTNLAVAEFSTDISGIKQVTLTPTGGPVDVESGLGNYSNKLRIYYTGVEVFSKDFNVLNRNLPQPTGTANVPNQGNMLYFNDYILRAYDRIKEWDGGETHNVILYTNNTSIGLDFGMISGKPIGLNVTVLEPSGTPVNNATVLLSERNGFQSWALLQYEDSNVSNYVNATVTTDSTGNARFIIIPTGGFASADSILGDYNITVYAFRDDGTMIFSSNMTVSDRTLPAAGTGSEIPNQAELTYYNDFILRLYDRVIRWLT